MVSPGGSHGEMKGGMPPRIVAWPLLAARGVIILAFAIMIAITFLQVVFRYLLAAPLPWSEEAARYCFVWIVFLGAALGLQRGVHLGVDLVVNRLPARMQRAISILCDILIAGFALSIIYASGPVLQLNAFQHSPALGIQMSWIYLAIPASMVLMLLVTTMRIAATLRTAKG